MLEEERRLAGYFDVVDLIDRVLPPKQEMNYYEISPQELEKRFNEEIEKSGFYFREENLATARKIILDIQEFNYDTEVISNPSLVANGFDRRNYMIQNHLSNMKMRLISTLTSKMDLIDTEDIYVSDRLGSIDEVRDRLTKESIEDYVRKTLDVSWAKGQTMSLESIICAEDILLHFAISPENSELRNYISNLIGEWQVRSTVFEGPIDSEGNYNSATTSKTAYEFFLEKTIHDITERLYSSIKSTLDRAEIERAYKIEKLKAKGKVNSPSSLDRQPSTTLPEKQPSTTLPKNKPSSEVKVSDDIIVRLKEQKAKYERLQKLIEMNIKLVQEKEELERQLAENAKKIQEIEDEVRSLS